jgi:hypothetical protein
MVEHALHSIFARIYKGFAKSSERRGGFEHRRKLLAGVNGRVIEVGAGSGAKAVCGEPHARNQREMGNRATTAPCPRLRMSDHHCGSPGWGDRVLGVGIDSTSDLRQACTQSLDDLDVDRLV